MLTRTLMIFGVCASLALVITGSGALDYRDDQQAWMVYPARCLKVEPKPETRLECPMANGEPVKDKCSMKVVIQYPVVNGQPDKEHAKLVNPSIVFDPNCQWANVEVRKIK
jgi:hypothetical protein